MRVFIMDGSPAAGSTLDGYLEGLARELGSGGHSVGRLKLRDLTFSHCVGCFGCWVKTPGRCVARDDTDTLRREVINTDFLLLASPVIMGFPSALLKKAQDKLIPLILPYFEISGGQVRHLGRYERYPRLGLLLEKGGDTDDEDIDIITDIYHRLAFEFGSSLAFVRLTADSVREVADEINRV